MDREKVIHAVETAFDVWIDEYTGCSWFKVDDDFWCAYGEKYK